MSETPSKTGNMTPSMKFELERREARSFRPDAEVVARGTAITLHSTVMAMRAELATLREENARLLREAKQTAYLRANVADGEEPPR